MLHKTTLFAYNIQAYSRKRLYKVNLETSECLGRCIKKYYFSFNCLGLRGTAFYYLIDLVNILSVTHALSPCLVLPPEYQVAYRQVNNQKYKHFYPYFLFLWGGMQPSGDAGT